MPLSMRSHEWTRMPAQRKSVKNKRVAVRGLVGGTTNAFNGSNVFSPMLIKFSLMRIGDFPYETVPSPERRRSFSGGFRAVAWGSQAREVRKKEERKRREESPRALKGKRRKGK